MINERRLKLRKLLKHAERDLKSALDYSYGVDFTDFMRECLIDDIGEVHARIAELAALLTDPEMQP